MRMIRRTALFLLFAACLITRQGMADDGTGIKIRAMTFNLWRGGLNGGQPLDRPSRPFRLARQISLACRKPIVAKTTVRPRLPKCSAGITSLKAVVRQSSAVFRFWRVRRESGAFKSNSEPNRKSIFSMFISRPPPTSRIKFLRSPMVMPRLSPRAKRRWNGQRSREAVN